MRSASYLYFIKETFFFPQPGRRRSPLPSCGAPWDSRTAQGPKGRRGRTRGWTGTSSCGSGDISGKKKKEVIRCFLKNNTTTIQRSWEKKVYARRSYSKISHKAGLLQKSIAGGQRPGGARTLGTVSRSTRQLMCLPIIAQPGVLKSQRCVKTWTRSRPRKGRNAAEVFCCLSHLCVNALYILDMDSL